MTSTCLLHLLSLSTPPFLVSFLLPVLAYLFYVILSCISRRIHASTANNIVHCISSPVYADRLSRIHDPAYILACALPHGPAHSRRPLPICPSTNPSLAPPSRSQLATSTRTRH